MSSPFIVFRFSFWQRSLASDVMNEINSETHSCIHSRASFAICKIYWKTFTMLSAWNYTCQAFNLPFHFPVSLASWSLLCWLWVKIDLALAAVHSSIGVGHRIRRNSRLDIRRSTSTMDQSLNANPFGCNRFFAIFFCVKILSKTK